MLCNMSQNTTTWDNTITYWHDHLVVSMIVGRPLRSEKVAWWWSVPNPRLNLMRTAAKTKIEFMLKYADVKCALKAYQQVIVTPHWLQ